MEEKNLSLFCEIIDITEKAELANVLAMEPTNTRFMI